MKAFTRLQVLKDLLVLYLKELLVIYAMVVIAILSVPPMTVLYLLQLLTSGKKQT